MMGPDMLADPIKLQAMVLVVTDPPGTWTPDHLADSIDESRGYVFAAVDDLMELGAIAWHGRGEGLAATRLGMRMSGAWLTKKAALA